MASRVTRRRSGRASVLALVGVVIVVASACGSSNPTPAPAASSAAAASGAPASAGPSPDAAATPNTGSPGAPAVAVPPTSEALIAAALAANTITYEQSLLYRALALFGSSGLPAEYRSPVPDMDAATALFGEVDQHEATLSKSLLDQLAPYRVRPSDPTSIFNNPPKQASLDVVLAAANTAPAWVSWLTAGNRARVWVKNSPDAATQLDVLAAAIGNVWAQFPGIFRYPEPDTADTPNHDINPDSAIDFYFVNASDLDPRRPACVGNPELPNCLFGAADYGYAQRTAEFRGPSSSAYLVFDIALGDAGLKGQKLPEIVAHELTHAAQFAYDRNESSWLMESTATWAAYRVMQKLGLKPDYAYGMLSWFFQGLDEPLDRVEPGAPDLNEYGSWLYFLFASMEEGDSVVEGIWQAAAADGVQGAKAVDQVIPFDKYFGRFGVRNWNQDPVTPQYKDVDSTFPTDLKPKIAGGPTVIDGAGEALVDTSVRALSTVYHDYQFKDAVRKVTFDNQLTGVANAHVWAIAKIGETWSKPEDWSKVATKDFCRDLTDQDLSELVLIVSDSDLKQTLAAPQKPRVVTKTTGCKGWVGTIHGESTALRQSSLTAVEHEKSDTQVTFIPNPFFPTYDDVEFVSDTGSVAWTFEFSDTGCHVSSAGSYALTPYNAATGQSEGSIDFLDSSPPNPSPLPGTPRYAGRAFTSEGVHLITSGIPSCPSAINPTSSPGVAATWWNIPKEAGAKVAADGKTMTGSWTSVDQGGDFTYTWTWTLHYIGP